MHRIAKKLNKSIEQLNYDVYSMFNQGEVNLAKVPVNVLNYLVVDELSDDLVDHIHNVLSERTANRLANFESLIYAISSNSDPMHIIGQHLGINNK